MKPGRTRAVVLRRTNFGEADRILHLLTPDGKISVIAKGARREKSKLASGIELFAVSDVVIVKGKGDLDVLTSARLVHFYRHIIEDYDRMQFAYAAIKLVSGASETSDDPQWYDVLVELLAGLDSHPLQLELVQAWFYLRYAAMLGYELSLYKDINGEKISPDLKYRYDLSERGFKPVQAGELSSEHIKLLRLIASRSLKTLSQIGGIDAVLSDCLMVARQHAAV